AGTRPYRHAGPLRAGWPTSPVDCRPGSAHQRDQSTLTYLMVCGPAGAATIRRSREMSLFSGSSLRLLPTDTSQVRVVHGLAALPTLVLNGLRRRGGRLRVQVAPAGHRGLERRVQLVE